MTVETDVLIVGAGIGGLTLALALHAQGIPCLVIEGTAEFQSIGAGINLLPHAVEPLAGIGLYSALLQNANSTTFLQFYSRHGAHIYTAARGTKAGHSWPQLSIHRARLHELLVQEFKARLGETRLHMDAKCVGLEQRNDGVAVLVSNRAGETRTIAAGIVVGCDGIRSRVRQMLAPNEGEPLYSGVMMWRGIAEMPCFLDGSTMVLAGSLRSGKMVAYPISGISPCRTQRVNWVAEIRTQHRSQASWDVAGQRQDLTWADRDWHLPWLDVAAMIRTTSTIMAYPMVDKDPLDAWSQGRITLLGDAAHPMYPFGSNGACQAILDGFTLAECLSCFGLTERALEEYQQARLPPTKAVTLLNRTIPPDVVLDEVDARTRGEPFDAINSVISQTELAEIMGRYQQISAGRIPQFSRCSSLAHAAG